MAAGVKIREFEQAAYVPAFSNAICGIIGPATKGPINTLQDFTDEGNLVNIHGRPVDRQHAVRAAIRYLRFGSQLKFVRIAGTLLQTAYVEQLKEVGGETIPIIRIEAASPGTWANGEVKVNISHNGSPATSYNIYVLFQNRIVQRFLNLTNATAENVVNNNSSYIQITIHEDAGATLPDETKSSTTEQFIPLVLQNGNDGCFASSNTPDSSSLGVSALNDFVYDIPANTTVDYGDTEPRTIAPGTFSVSTATPTETFTDGGDGILTGDAGGIGRIDYKSGVWYVAFNAIPTTPVAVAYKAGTHEVIGSTTPATLSYSGTLGRYGIRPSFITIYIPKNDQLEIGDGVTTTYTPSVAAGVLPGSVHIVTTSISGDTLEVTDDGQGVLTGDVSAPGTVNYVTGALSWDFDVAPRLNEPIMGEYSTIASDNGSGVIAGATVTGTVNYQTGAWTLVFTFVPVGDYEPGLATAGAIDAMFFHTTVAAFGDGLTTEFSGTLREHPIKAGSVKVYYVTATPPLTDNGFGIISGAGGTGTIDYFTGEYTLDFTGAPALSFPIQINADSVILDFACRYAGPIGNEREILTDGIYVWIDKSANTPTTPNSALWYRARVMFNPGTGTEAVETFDPLRNLEELVSTINDLSTGSQYVQAVLTGVPGELDTTFDSNEGQKIGMDGAFSHDDVIGTHIGNAYTGLQLFTPRDVVPLNFLSAPGMYHRQIQLAGIEICENRQAVWLFSIPDLATPAEAVAFVNGEYNAASLGGDAVPTADVPYPPLAAVNSSYAFASALWLRYYDQYSDTEVGESPEGDILALIAQTDQKFAPWQTICGERRGQISNVVSIRYAPTEEERSLMLGINGTRYEVVNPIVEFVGAGIFLYGENTMDRSANPMSRLHSRWTANLIAIELLRVGRTFVFELNDDFLWREIERTVQSMLRPIRAKRGIIDFRVICDATTNTPDLIAQRKALCKIFIQFAEAAEEIEFQMIYTPVNAEFSEVAPRG